MCTCIGNISFTCLVTLLKVFVGTITGQLVVLRSFNEYFGFCVYHKTYTDSTYFDSIQCSLLP